MGTTGEAGRAPGRWDSISAGLRLLVGWFSVAIAVLNLLTELDRAPERAYLLFHAVLLIGGALLIVVDPEAAGTGPVAGSTGGAVLVAGTLVSALPVNTAACCMSGFAVRHGYPFAFLARAEGGSWHLDSQHLLADLLFWGYAGLVVLVLVTLTRRITQHRGGAGG
jgi:hypothetical protein